MATCLFCNNEQLTQEHIWPDWIVREFKQHRKCRFRFAGPAEYTATATETGRVIRTYPTNSIEVKQRLVCGDCNNRWMSDIETETKPILRPLVFNSMLKANLTELDRRTVAAWMTLRTMVLDATIPDAKLGPGKYYSQVERTRFKNHKHLAPPKDTFIWAAPFIGKALDAKFQQVSSVDETKDAGFLATTCVMNEIAIQMVTCRGEPRRFGVNLDALKREGWNNVTRLLWPIRRRTPLSWPPPKYLTDTSLEILMDRFQVPPGFV